MTSKNDSFFTIGKSYSTWKRMGIKNDQSFETVEVAGKQRECLQISENDGSCGWIEPSDKLIMVGRSPKGHPLFMGADGRVLRGHRNHFDASAKYNTEKKGTRKAKGLTEAELLAALADLKS